MRVLTHLWNSRIVVEFVDAKTFGTLRQEVKLSKDDRSSQIAFAGSSVSQYWNSIHNSRPSPHLGSGFLYENFSKILRNLPVLTVLQVEMQVAVPAPAATTTPQPKSLRGVSVAAPTEAGVRERGLKVIKGFISGLQLGLELRMRPAPLQLR